MSRLSGPKRKKIYEQLVRRDGECCYVGGEPGNSKTLVIDHLDNDNSNNKLSNLHLFCPSLNSVKNPRRRSRKLSSESESQREIDQPLASSAEFKKNQQAEPDFKHWLFAEVWRKGRIEMSEAINCGAAVARCSQEVIRRYILKEVSRVRPYQLIEDEATKSKFVVFRPKWEKARKKEEKRRTLDRQSRNWYKKDDGILGKPQTATGTDGSGKVHKLRGAGPS